MRSASTKSSLSLAGLALVVLTALPLARCRPAPESEPGPTVSEARPIADIIREQAPRWMERPDVVGVYEGVEEGEPCIKVMVTEITEEIREAIPSVFEGHRIVLTPTGPIVPREG